MNVAEYWSDPPPFPSPRLVRWIVKIENGWRPNARIRGMGYHEASEFFGVYIWEYFNVLLPLLYPKYFGR